ncbi:uncharacterized protein (DUF433 family) [Bradyrhizobium sp. USDA 3262]|jgi:uncharacterized protein (DUF433 family)
MVEITPFSRVKRTLEYPMPRPDSNVVVSAFTEDQVVRLTGISISQLRYWDRTDFFRPSLAYEDRRAAHSRIYSFRDIVCLKVVNSIRNESSVPLPRLRAAKEKLRHLGDDLWAKTTLYVLNRRIVFFNPETDRKEDVETGQAILEIPLKVVSGDMESAVRALSRRPKTEIGRIDRHRNVMSNQEVIAGTRIPVRSVKAFADAGYSVDAIQKEYPTLTEQDIRAAIKHAAA